MRIAEEFGSWEGYRSFVETAQRDLFERLREEYERSALDFDEREYGGALVSDDARLDVDWPAPFHEKWERTPERAILYADTVKHHLWDDDRQTPAEGITDPELMEHAQAVVESDGVDYFHGDDERYFWYECYAPPSALATEAYLDAATCYLCGLTQVDGDARGDLYDAALAADERGNSTAYFVTEWLFVPFDRSAVVDGSAFSTAFDDLERRYEELAALTVWGTNPDRDLAVPDERLPEGAGHPRTWDVRPAQALAGIDWALTAPEDAHATVTVDATHDYETPANHVVTGFHRGTVEECDDRFPAEPGDDVLVAAANLVGRAGGGERGPDGLTDEQRAVCERAEDDPDAVEPEERRRLETWATTGEPQVRERVVEALGSLAGADRHVDRATATLLDATFDLDAAVATAAVTRLEAVVADSPEAVAGGVTEDDVETLVERLSEGDEREQQTAARCLSVLARADPSVLSDRADRLRERFRETVARSYAADEEPVVRDELLAVHERLVRTDPGVVESAADPLVRMASYGADTAFEALSAVERGDPAFDAAVAAVRSQLRSDLTDGHQSIRERGARKLARFAERRPDLLVAADLGDLLVETIRGDRKGDGGMAPKERQHAVIAAAALSDGHLDVLREQGAVDALVDCLDEDVWKRVTKTAADALAAVGVRDPAMVEDAVDDVVGLLGHYKCNVRERGALTLGMFAAAEPALVADAVDPLADLATDDDACGHTVRSAWFALVAARDTVPDDLRAEALEYTRSKLRNTTEISPDIYLTFADVDPSLLEPVADALRSNPDVHTDDVTDLLGDDVEQHVDRDPGVAYAPLDHPCEPDRIKWSDPVE